MPVYDQSAAPEVLRYDFSSLELKHADGSHWEAHDLVGDIPEPSDDAVEQLFNEDLPAINANIRAITREWMDSARAARAQWWESTPIHPTPERPADLLDIPDQDLPVDLLATERDNSRERSRHAREVAREATLDAWAKFCDGCPSRELLAALPYRAFQHWTGWMTGQFSPEALAAATNR